MLSNQSRLHSLLKVSQPSDKERDEILKLIRQGHYDLPDAVFEHSFALLKKGAQSQNRFYQAKELINSGLELQVGSKLKGYLQKFREALGDVPAIRKLTAFMDFTLAQEPSGEHYDDLLVDDRTDYDSRKRALTALKASYEWEEYAQKINQYLRQNPNDVEAWLQLGDLYAERSQYLRALFCFEEVVLLSPDNDYYFLRLAELYYTDGGKQNLANAGRYYSYVVSRNPRNPRALWGLYRTLWAQREGLQESDRELLQVEVR